MILPLYVSQAIFERVTMKVFFDNKECLRRKGSPLSDKHMTLKCRDACSSYPTTVCMSGGMSQMAEAIQTCNSGYGTCLNMESWLADDHKNPRWSVQLPYSASAELGDPPVHTRTLYARRDGIAPQN